MSNKKTMILIGLGILILLIIILAFFLSKNSVENSKKGVMIDDVKTSIGGEVEKTNPFKADVNPYNGYKNPFTK